MDKREIILDAAERAFLTEGFRATGIDRVLAPTGVSTRTLYKNFATKEALALAVLERRDRRFYSAMAMPPDPGGDPVQDLFTKLAHWTREEGANGCIFLRALGEYGLRETDIAAFVEEHKRRMRALVADRVTARLGRAAPPLADRIWILFEGATASAAVAGEAVIGTAAAAADDLMDAASRQ
ncbi:TetR/AcrR family transcriptional regulator [Nisaea acidiphila]|uniref:TetR/AcrR family transcriptional regulator n=1 Tax=Nisaea acidiphila TaxID=1862145 RepID=A0A9J7AQT0_9PROT|nr:TetR/AcrR family transcriptional regulator [Nisaea acidiphila]UUX49591.1 TetR/AcrR family transcriptional regulator [Nisaea acidiphila]